MQVSVEFLGRTRVWTGSREVVLSRQSISFLAYLVLFREIDLPRDVLIEEFWSSCEPARAKACLGTALSRLKNCLQIDGMNWIQVSQRGEPRISPAAPIWFDVVAFETDISSSLSAPAGKLEAPLVDGLKTALGHYRGDLLLGWYDNWVLTERERLRLLCLRGYRRLMDHYTAIEDLDSALEAGLSSLRLEPLQELIQQRVIELYAASGQRVGAIRQYERLAQLLKSELGIAPSRATRSLIESIKAERPV